MNAKMNPFQSVMFITEPGTLICENNEAYKTSRLAISINEKKKLINYYFLWEGKIYLQTMMIVDWIDMSRDVNQHVVLVNK